MSDVKALLDEATPLPWRLRTDVICFRTDPPPTGPVWGTYVNDHFIPSVHDPIGEKPSPDWHSPDAALIVHAVNRLPDYEALADAALALLEEWDVFGPTGTQDTLDTHRSLRAALRRLRGES